MTDKIEENVIEYDMYIHGEWRPAASGERMNVYNPATGEIGATVPRGVAADMEAAMDSAKDGLKTWRSTHPAERARIMWRIALAIRERDQELARLETHTGGGSMSGALHTVNEVCARRFEYFAGLADKILGDTFLAPGEYFAFTLREPKGVTAHIIPWNGPLWTGSRSIAPALAAGNSLIVKPSRESPLSLLKLAEIAVENGLPPGVMNVVTGPGGELGDALTSHPDTAAIYFTGSGPTGKRVIESASGHYAHSVMELGGKSPNIIFSDAEMEPALYGALWAIFANAGQICVAGSRLLVESSIHDEFVSKLTELAQGLRLGGPDREADMGPVISQRQQDSILNYIEIGINEAELLTGGKKADDPSLAGGYFIEPTIFDKVPVNAKIAQEEIFGPVLAVTTFDELDEAVNIANDSPFGLASAVWTSNLTKAHLVAQRLEAAQVYVNHYFSSGFEVTRTPYKASGFGHSEGQDSILEYLNTKTVSLKMPE
jgi:acyl-CoA reductase-like NAD-dependent aldehyde dehydrogenase